MSNNPQPPDPIDKILEDFAASISPVVVMGNPSKNPYAKPQFINATKAKLNTLMLSRKAVEEALPEKKKDTTAQDLRSGDYKRGDGEYRKGYNQAISDIRAALGIQKD